MIRYCNKVNYFLGYFMSSDIIFTTVYLAQDQFETFVEQIKMSNLPKPTQWHLIDLLKTARQHIEHARQMGWIPDTV